MGLERPPDYVPPPPAAARDIARALRTMVTDVVPHFARARLPRGSAIVRAGPLRVVFAEPIEDAGTEEAELAERVAKTFERVKAEYALG